MALITVRHRRRGLLWLTPCSRASFTLPMVNPTVKKSIGPPIPFPIFCFHVAYRKLRVAQNFLLNFLLQYCHKTLLVILYKNLSCFSHLERLTDRGSTSLSIISPGRRAEKRSALNKFSKGAIYQQKPDIYRVYTKL
jgi:hypothetical protein